MAEYAPGLTFGQCCNLDKERIKHALAGELMVGENENGFVYGKANMIDCAEFILRAFDNVVFQCKQSMDSGRAMETLMRKHGITIDLREYMQELEQERLKFNDYVYEGEENNG